MGQCLFLLETVVCSNLIKFCFHTNGNRAQLIEWYSWDSIDMITKVYRKKGFFKNFCTPLSVHTQFSLTKFVMISGQLDLLTKYLVRNWLESKLSICRILSSAWTLEGKFFVHILQHWRNFQAHCWEQCLIISIVV